jgi:DNA-binding MarR family transcriptional regulator
LISQIKQLGSRIFEKVLAEKNVSAFNGAQGRILYILWQNDAVSITELSENTGLAKTSLTSMLDRMEESELIARIPAPGDRRKTLISLRDKAKTLRKAYDEVSDNMSDIYYENFTDKEIQNFENYLKRILVNLKKQEENTK